MTDKSFIQGTKYLIPDAININGVDFTGAGLIGVLTMITDPIPNRWYTFKREGRTIIVTTRQEKDDSQVKESAETNS